MKQLFFRKTLFSLSLVLACTFLLIACVEKKNTNNDPAQAETVKIGSYYPLSGDVATFGLGSKRGIELAIAEVNKAGGLLGKQVELVIEDDRGSQQEARTAVQKLIDKDKVVAVIGEAVSTNSIAGGQICQAKSVPMITPSSTNPQVTQIGDYIFRTCFLDDFQGEVMARFAANTLKAKKVAIFYDNSSDYSLGLAKYFREAFKKLGGEIIIEEAFQSKDSNFSAQLTKLAAAKPEAIYVPGYYTQVGQIAQQARKAGLNVPLLGGDGWDSPTLMDIGKEALNGCYFSNHYSVEDEDPAIKQFVANFKNKYGEVPDSASALAYDAMLILADAIKRANSTNSKAIRDALSQTRDFKGMTGVISIGPTRDAVKSAVIVGIEEGRYKVKEKMAPSADALVQKAGK